jgi:tripartite-type tricarboxylate transporter receptor subunit TctC
VKDRFGGNTDMPKFSRRTAFALPLGLLPCAVRAQAPFPEKPLRWLVGYPAGGGTDVLARLLAASMQPRLGQPVVIENRPGAATALAAEALVRAPPDGHTVMTADIGTLVFNPALYKRLPYDANADFRPLGLMGRFHLVLAVKAASPSTTAADLVARAKADPDKLTYGSPGVGSPHHIAMERLLRDTGAKLEHAPYRGMAPVLNDLLAGSIDVAIVDYAAGGEALRAGRIRPLAVASATRLAGLPDVPTITEALGLAGFEAYAWQGLVARTATPDAVAARLTAELAQALADPAVLTRMREIGLDPLPGTPAEQAALQAAEQALWWPLIKALKIELD